MTKQEEIREGTDGLIGKHLSEMGCEFTCIKAETRVLDMKDRLTDSILSYLHSQGVVIKVDRELPYEWDVFTREHSYPPHKKFTTYALKNRNGKMFGYIQKYQSLTGYKCFEKPVSFSIYLGNEEWAHSYKSAPTLKRAKEILIEQFLSSKDNLDKQIPTSYVAVEPLIGAMSK